MLCDCLFADGSASQMGRPSPKTQSEGLFEQFCAEHRVRCDPIPRQLGLTPDYDVYFGERQVVVEVKQLEPNEEDAAKIKLFEEGKQVSFGGEAGKRVRQEITRAKKQLQARAKDRFPALLVLYNTQSLIHYFDPMFIMIGMYGQMVVHVAVPPNGGQPFFLDALSHGGKRMVSPDHNTTISALCVLIENPDGEPTLTFYHNRYAAKPFVPDWFRADRVKHYQTSSTQAHEFGGWVPA